MKIDIEVDGFQELDRTLALFSSKQERAIRRKGLLAAARVARNKARKTTAFTDRREYLRGQINVTQEGRWKLVRLRANAPHAHLVEGGHGGPRPAPPHPFLAPAVESTQSAQHDKCVAVMKREISKLVAKGARK